MPRGTHEWGDKNLRQSSLPSARKVSWELHHDSLYPKGDITAQAELGSDPTCDPELRFGGCNSCYEPTCQREQKPKTCEYQQPCPRDKTTAARLGGNGALATHMVRKICRRLLCPTLFKGDAVWTVFGALIFHDIPIRWKNHFP